MKNAIYGLLCLFLVSSCKTSLYFEKKNAIKVSNKSQYTVTYIVDLKEGVTARVNYTDESGKLIKTKGASGYWKKTVIVPRGTHIKIKALANAKKKTSSAFKVLVDDQVISETKLYDFNSKYSLNFDLP